MAIYTVGRRRVIVALLLTLLLLLTLDLRGNPVLDRVRDGFARAMAPIESATDVITTPVSRAWNGVTQYDDLERENEALQDRLDRLIGTQATARLSVEEAAELKALLSLNSLAGIPTEVAKVVGASSNNLDQIIEIDIGRTRGVRVGMPVVNQAGLIGKITSVTDNTAKVMLITDSRYVVPVRVQAAPAADLGPTDTRPSGRTNEELEDLVATTLVTDVLASESSLPQNDGANGDPTIVDDPTSGDLPVSATSTILEPNDGESPAEALPVDGEVIETTTTTTTNGAEPDGERVRCARRARAGVDPADSVLARQPESRGAPGRRPCRHRWGLRQPCAARHPDRCGRQPCRPIRAPAVRSSMCSRTPT